MPASVDATPAANLRDVTPPPDVALLLTGNSMIAAGSLALTGHNVLICLIREREREVANVPATRCQYHAIPLSHKPSTRKPSFAPRRRRVQTASTDASVGGAFRSIGGLAQHLPWSRRVGPHALASCPRPPQASALSDAAYDDVSQRSRSRSGADATRSAAGPQRS